MTFAKAIRPRIDRIRTIPGRLGLRPYTVTVRVITWDGGSVGSGNSTETDTQLFVGTGGRQQNPKVRRVAYKETVAGGGKYQEGDYRIGPFTGEYSGGGVPFATMAPPTTDGTEVYYLLVGPDTLTDGTTCTVVGQEADHSLHRYLVVRPIGAVL